MSAENLKHVNKSQGKAPVAKYSRHATVNIISEAPQYETTQILDNRSIDDIQIRTFDTIKDDSKSNKKMGKFSRIFKLKFIVLF